MTKTVTDEMKANELLKRETVVGKEDCVSLEEVLKNE